MRKYSGLQWHDLDEKGQLTTVWDGEVCFYDAGEARRHFIYGMYAGFVPELGIDGNDWGVHNVSSRMSGFYGQIIAYYKGNLDPDVTILEFDMENDSELETELEARGETVEEEGKSGGV